MSAEVKTRRCRCGKIGSGRVSKLRQDVGESSNGLAMFEWRAWMCRRWQRIAPASVSEGQISQNEREREKKNRDLCHVEHKLYLA